MYNEQFLDISKNKTDDEIEVGFLFLNQIAKLFGDFRVLLFITASINLYVIFFLLKKMSLNVPLGLLTYYSVFYLNHNFNTIKHGLMTSVIWVSFYFFLNNKKIKSFIFYLISFTFHQAAIIFYPALYLTKVKLNLKIIAIIFFFVFFIKEFFLEILIYLSNINSNINYYLYDYYLDESSEYHSGLGFLLYIIIIFLVFSFKHYFRDQKQIIFFNKILAIGAVSMIFFSSIGVFVERISNVFIFSLVFIISSVDKLIISSKTKRILVLVIILINFFFLLKVLSIPGMDTEYQFVPYKLSF